MGRRGRRRDDAHSDGPPPESDAGIPAPDATDAGSRDPSDAPSGSSRRSASTETPIPSARDVDPHDVAARDAGVNDAHATSASPFYTPRPLRRRGQPSKARLEAMLRLAKFYRGWTAKDLAGELDRHVHNLVPGSGVPKIDLVVGISDLLDWPVEVVIDDLYERSSASAAHPDPSAGDAELRERLQEAWRLVDADRLVEAVDFIEATLRQPLDALSFSYASSLLSDAYEGLGRYLQAIDVLRRGLSRARRENPYRERLLLHLAHCHYLVGNLGEAELMASAMVDELLALPADDSRRTLCAAALFIRGSCRRTMCSLESALSPDEARAAADDLGLAATIYRDRSASEDPARLEALARLAEFARLEPLVILGEVSARAAIDQIITAVDSTDVESIRTKHEAETLAWGCVHGSTIVLRHLRDAPDAHRLLAILTNLTDLLAGRLGHWALRERCWTIEHLWRVEGDGGECTLDLEDIQTLTGTMGRFPEFRERGWALLEQWRFQEDSE